MPLSTYRAQRRGGKGRTGMSTKEATSSAEVFVCNTHTPVLFFSSAAWSTSSRSTGCRGTPQARGKALVNLLPLEEGETISTVMAMPEDEEAWGDLCVMFATSSGTVRRNRLSDFVRVMANGKIAMKLDEGDSLVGVSTCTEDNDVLLATHLGKCDPLPGGPTCASSAAAPPPACAASSWRRTTG